jgi:hypothetical protein
VALHRGKFSAATSGLSITTRASKQTTAADVVAKAQGVLSEAELLRAMFDVGYFPPSTPPDNIKVGVSLRVPHENT